MSGFWPAQFASTASICVTTRGSSQTAGSDAWDAAPRPLDGVETDCRDASRSRVNAAARTASTKIDEGTNERAISSLLEAQGAPFPMCPGPALRGDAIHRRRARAHA